MQQGKLKVTVSLAKGLHPMWEDATGIRFTDAFVDRLREKDEYFRERIILPINDLAGNDWAVHFTEYPVTEATYLVDVTAEDRFLTPIIRMISCAFPDVNLQFWKPNPYVHVANHRALVIKEEHS
jgi:hypothetical protein